MPDDSFLNSPRSHFRAALILAIVADAVQIVVFPLFVEGALSPLDDILDLIVAVALFRLLGWPGSSCRRPWPNYCPALYGSLLDTRGCQHISEMETS